MAEMREELDRALGHSAENGLFDNYDPVPGLVARGVMSDEHDPDSCEAVCCTPPDNPIIHRPGCSWETTPYCGCGADPERALPPGRGDA